MGQRQNKPYGLRIGCHLSSYVCKGRWAITFGNLVHVFSNRYLYTKYDQNIKKKPHSASPAKSLGSYNCHVCLSFSCYCCCFAFAYSPAFMHLPHPQSSNVRSTQQKLEAWGIVYQLNAIAKKNPKTINNKSECRRLTYNTEEYVKHTVFFIKETDKPTVKSSAHCTHYKHQSTLYMSCLLVLLGFK